jgi:hypothetical protein
VLGALLPSKSCRMAAPPILPNLLTVEIEALQGTVGLQCLPMAAPPSSPMSQPAPHSIINHRPSHAQSPLWFTISTYCPSSFSMHHSTPPLLPQPHALCSALASATLRVSARASLTTLSATLMHLVACPVVLPCICHGVRHLVHLCWVPYCHPRAATWLHPPSFLPFSLLQ